MDQKGISVILIILIIVGILAAGAGTYWYYLATRPIPYESEPPCNNRSRICPDGKTLIPYTGRNCDIAICPGEINMADWQTYRNEKFGIELKYPADVFTVQGDDQYSKTITFIDKRFAGQNVDIATVPNYFSIDLAKDNSIDSLVEGERIFFSAPKSQTTILRTEEITIDSARAVKVVTGDKSTMIEKGFFIVTELPRVVSISSQTYNLVSFGGKSETPGFIDKIIESIKFLK